MDLDELWEWDKRKLACRIRPEHGNPAGDSLRETFAELAGVDLNDLLNEMKTTKKKKEQTNKVSIDHEADKSFREVQGRSRILGAAKLALVEMEEYDSAKAKTITQKNKKKLFTVLPKSPPKRVMLDIQRERSKPLRLPDQEEHKASTDKLDKKLAKQRAARMAAIEQSAKEDSAANQANAGGSHLGGLLTTSVFGTYQGDLFSTGGQYLEGMIYLSRMADSSLRTKRLNTAMTEFEKKKSEELLTTVEAEKNADRDTNKDLEVVSMSEISTNPDINAKLNCAVSLCNWSRNPANASRLASEGAVRAIMTLSLESVSKITVYCAAAFRFMSEQPILAASMIDEGAITTISELLSSKSDDFIIYNLAIALVNLTRVNGKEGQLVEAAIILALSNLIQQKPELAPTCVRGLYNLTCVDLYYPSIEKIIGKLVNLVTSGTANVKHLYAATLCNLSDLKSLRARMVEEGAIAALSTLSRGAETRTRRICAVILQNLSAAKSVRVEMASRNSVAVAYGLSSDQDPIILRCIGLTLSRLAMEPSNCQRIVHEGGIVALCNIAMKYPSIPGITQPVASAFQLLSSNPSHRVNIVNEGCVTAVASLLRSSADMFTLQHSLLALCNLLCEAENHLPIIQQGLILTLIAMSGNENHILKDFCSLAFLNLSSAEDSRKHLVNAGAVTAVIALAKETSDITKRRCAATFCNLSYYALGMTRMVADGIIPAIVDLVLAKDMVTVHCSCAALCRLCSTVENARLILDSGAVPNLVQGAMEGDPVTKQFCGSVLSTLSFYEYCRIPLCELGAIEALKGLADLNDDVTKQRCLLAFANLSGEVTVQAKMITSGVVGIIAELANSYREVNYMCCAKAICNLACCAEMKLAVAREGGVHALLMISMVQSVDRLTKVVCVLGLNNLLDESTMAFMVGEGLVGSMANLSKIGESLGDAHISNLCAKVLNQLSRYPLARQKMIEKVSTLQAIFKLTESTAAETQIIATRTTCNLLLDEHARGSVLKASGVINTLEKGVTIHHKETVYHTLKTLFSLCTDAVYMESLAKTSLPLTLAGLMSKSQLDSEEYDWLAKTLAAMCFEKKSRFFLQKPDFVSAVLNVLAKNYRAGTAVWLLVGLAALLVDFHAVNEVMDRGILSILHAIHAQLSSSAGAGAGSGNNSAPRTHDQGEVGDSARHESYRAMVEIIHLLSEQPACLPHLIGCMPLLHTALGLLEQEDSADRVSSYPADWVIYHIAVIVYRFVSTDAASRLSTANADTRSLLESLSKHPKCAELVVSSYGMYLMDHKCRGAFINVGAATALVRLHGYGLSESSLSNLVLAVYAMSKVAACREFMMAAPLHCDRLLLQAACHDNPRIKANANRAYKTLNADVNEAIEEGAVATLIAMSIEGKLKNQASDEFSLPVVVPLPESKLRPPACLSDMLTSAPQRQAACWYARVVVAKGGAAGKGPDPPEPPSLSDPSSSSSSPSSGSTTSPTPSLLQEDLDTANEPDAKPRMSFAKMAVPHALRDAFLLSDADFLITLERDETATLAEESTTTSEEVHRGPTDPTTSPNPFGETTTTSQVDGSAVDDVNFPASPGSGMGGSSVPVPGRTPSSRGGGGVGGGGGPGSLSRGGTSRSGGGLSRHGTARSLEESGSVNDSGSVEERRSASSAGGDVSPGNNTRMRGGSPENRLKKSGRKASSRGL